MTFENKYIYIKKKEFSNVINFDLEWMSFVKRNKKKTKTKEYGCTSILVKESTSFYFLDVMKIISCLTLLSR